MRIWNRCLHFDVAFAPSCLQQIYTGFSSRSLVAKRGITLHDSCLCENCGYPQALLMSRDTSSEGRWEHSPVQRAMFQCQICPHIVDLRPGTHEDVM